MSHLDFELKKLKEESIEMFDLVTMQMRKSQQAFINLDRNIAHEVNFNEKRVNALELKIDKDCENIFALFNPVAVDLRFVLAVLKINSNLERIGDIADGISRYVVDSTNKFDEELLEVTRVNEMFEMAVNMLVDVRRAFDSEDSKLARGVFQKDELLDGINADANRVIENYIIKKQENISQSLHIISAIRKLERTGDQIKNVAEEIIFFLEAKVLKHVSPEKKM